MTSIKNKEPCSICGVVRETNRNSLKYGWICRKHYNQLNKYGLITNDSPRTQDDGNSYTIEDDYVKIELYDKNYNIVGYAKIDFEDINICNRYKWYLDSNGYARTTIGGIKIRLHKYLTNTDGDNLIDHINGDKLDCRRKNMRIASYSENNIKKVMQSNNTSKIIGVYFWKLHNYWVARMTYDNKKYLRYFTTKEEAVVQRLYWELKFLGDLAPQLELIKASYSYLYDYIKEENND